MRTSKKQLQSKVDRLNGIHAVGGIYSLDPMPEGTRLIWIPKDGGERQVSPRLRAGLLWDWIDAYTKGLEEAIAENAKMHAALMVISQTASIREWLSQNDKKALEQVEAALKG